MAIDDNTSYELTGYQVKDLAGRIRRKAEASSVPTSISDLGQVTSSDVDWSTMPGSYSTTEQKTPFTWIDGKPIYKKTFVVSIPSSGSVVSFQHGINNLGFYVKAEGVAVTSSRVTMRFLPDLYVENDSVNGMFGCAIYGGSVVSSSIDITYGSFYRGGTVYATIWYTKTTD